MDGYNSSYQGSDESVSPATRLIIVVVIGIIIGIIIALIIFVLMYYSRTFFFEYCSQEAPYCVMGDYVEDPNTALQWGYRHDEIFEIRDSNLYYIPPRRSHNCVPQRPPVVLIPYPQYCTFEINGQNIDFQQSPHRQEVYTRSMPELILNSDISIPELRINSDISIPELRINSDISIPELRINSDGDHQVLTRSGCRPISSINGPHPTAGHVSNRWGL